VERTDAILDEASQLAVRVKADVLVVITDHHELVANAMERASLPIVLATGNAEVHDAFAKRVRRAIHLAEPLSGTLAEAALVKDVLMTAFFQGAIRPDEMVVVLLSAGDSLALTMKYDVGQDVELVHLQESLADAADLRVVERVLKLAIEIAREGREGHAVGTLFVVGDSDAVLRHTRPAVLNPFEGHSEKDRNLLDDALWETAKEFAQIDGCFVVRGDGIVLAAGRYVDTQGEFESQSGLGGRHLAAASISSSTDALAIAVSSSGTIRLFQQGRAIMMVGRL